MINFSFCCNFSFSLDFVIALHLLLPSSLCTRYCFIPQFFPVCKLCRFRYVRYPISFGVWEKLFPRAFWPLPCRGTDICCPPPPPPPPPPGWGHPGGALHGLSLGRKPISWDPFFSFLALFSCFDRVSLPAAS